MLRINVIQLHSKTQNFEEIVIALKPDKKKLHKNQYNFVGLVFKIEKQIDNSFLNFLTFMIHPLFQFCNFESDLRFYSKIFFDLFPADEKNTFIT